MSRRLDKSWTVVASYQTSEADRCVDVFSRPEGTFGFEEFRRDPEDMGCGRLRPSTHARSLEVLPPRRLPPDSRCRGWPPFPSSGEMLAGPYNMPFDPTVNLPRLRLGRLPAGQRRR